MQSAKKPKLLNSSAEQSSANSLLKKLSRPFTSPQTKSGGITVPENNKTGDGNNTTIDDMLMDPPTPTPVLRSSGRLGKLNFLPKFGKTSAEYSVSPGSNNKDVNNSVVDAGANNKNSDGGYPTYRRKNIDDDPPTPAGVKLVAPSARAPLVESEGGTPMKKIDSKVASDVKNEEKVAKIDNNKENVNVNVKPEVSENKGESCVVVGAEEVNDDDDVVDGDVEKGGPVCGAGQTRQWNWFLPSFGNNGGRNGAAAGSAWGGFPRKMFAGFKRAANNDVDDDDGQHEVSHSQFFFSITLFKIQ